MMPDKMTALKKDARISRSNPSPPFPSTACSSSRQRRALPRARYLREAELIDPGCSVPRVVGLPRVRLARLYDMQVIV